MCIMCDMREGKFIPPGGMIYQDEEVMLTHCFDVKVPGYLILTPKNHVETYENLSANEINRLSLVMQKAMKGLKQKDEIERVYFASVGELTKHFHMHIFPRYKKMLALDEAYYEEKIDGVQLFSYVRQNDHVDQSEMETDDIIEMVEFLRESLKEQ